MKINYRISPTANQFFFISTLAAWHYSCREDIRNAWLGEIGGLTDPEEKSLVVFSDIVKSRYGFRSLDSYIGNVFYGQNEDAIWPTLKKFVKNHNDYEVIEKTFRLFEKKFQIVWRKRNVKSLVSLKKSLRQKHQKDFIESIAKTFGAGSTPSEVTLCILFSPLRDQTASGGANLAGNSITVELPFLKEGTWQFAYSLSVIGHELGHLFFSKRGGEKMLKKTITSLRLKKNYDVFTYDTLTLLNEAVTASFVPLGVLGQKYFPKELSSLLFDNAARAVISEEQLRSGKKTRYYNQLEVWFIFHTFPLASKYLDEKREIDIEYVRSIGILIKSLLASPTALRKR
jgi:hypothetical protein